MGCCSWFDLFFSADTKLKASRSSISRYQHGSSQEHLLTDEAAKQLATESNQERAPPSIQQYIPPSVQEYQSSSPASDCDGAGHGHIVNAACDAPVKRVALDPSLRNVSFDNLGLAASNSHHVWRPRHIKFSRRAIRDEDYSGKKMVNNYVREGIIGIGSYSKVVLCRNVTDEELYAMKIVQKARLRKIKVSPSENALTDVYKEVSIMKELDHPNIVKLIEVIDDSESDRLYMILEYVEGRCMFEGSGPPGGIGEAAARRYFRDVVAGVVYLHSHRIIHGDIKPENLLISASGQVKICDFSVSQRFQGNNDELRRSPGTPVYTAPECITGPTYWGRAADVWALGVTLHCMVMGQFPFLGDTIQSTYDEIVHGTLKLPEGLHPQLANLLEGLLCKDPVNRMTLDKVAQHWFYVESS